MKKSILATLLVLVMLTQVSYAYTFPVLVKVNDHYVNVGDVVDQNGVHYVSARQMADCLGVLTLWEPATQSAHFTKYGRRLIVNDGVVKTYINDGFAGLATGVQSFVYQDKTYLPLRYFVEFFAADLTYSDTYATYTINSDSRTLGDEQYLIADDDRDDILWLARIVNVEARGGSMYKKLAVASVVMNRVKSDRFPNTVYSVIKQRGQFPPAYYSYFDTMTPSQESYTAAVHAFTGENVVEDCLYFNLKPFSWKPKEDFYREIEGDYFYR